MKAQKEAMTDNHRRVLYTVGLTESLEMGDITPAEYVRRRALLVGQGDIFQTLFLPFFQQILTVLKTLWPRSRSR